jgi:signal transduction histidine kinase
VTRRILLLGAATTSLVVVAFLVPMLVLVADVARARAEAAATIEAQLVASLVGVADEDSVRLYLDGLNAGTDRRTTVFLPDGRQLGAPADRDAAVQRAARDGQAFTDEAGGRAVLVPVTLGTGDRAVVRTFVPPAALAQGVRRAQLALVLLGAALLGVAVLVAGLLGRSLVRPLLAVARTADTLRGGALDARATAAGPAEVRRIAEALNRLAARIEELVQAERESVADISHRLRTPLTALRLDAEALPPPDAERLLADVDALERMVTHVINQARRPGRTGEADLAAVVRDRVEFWSVLADEQDRTVRTALPAGPVPVRLPADALAATVDALLGNVFAHTTVGVGFAVEVTAQPVPTLVVEDAGPGIADPELLGRGRSARTSTGLGLDIVRRTAEAAGGRFELQEASPTGLRAVVTFPRLPDVLGPPPGRLARQSGTRPAD